VMPTPCVYDIKRSYILKCCMIAISLSGYVHTLCVVVPELV
jgi:hypothetical protein